MYLNLWRSKGEVNVGKRGMKLPRLAIRRALLVGLSTVFWTTSDSYLHTFLVSNMASSNGFLELHGWIIFVVIFIQNAVFRLKMWWIKVVDWTHIHSHNCSLNWAIEIIRKLVDFHELVDNILFMKINKVRSIYSKITPFKLINLINRPAFRALPLPFLANKTDDRSAYSLAW